MKSYKMLNKDLIRYLVSAFLVASLFNSTSFGQTNDPNDIDPYCDETNDCGFDEDIDDFTFGSFSNTGTGCNNDGGTLTYFDNLGPISVEWGEDVSGSLTTGGSDLGIGIWIDYDHDGDFQDPDEFVYSSNSEEENHSFNVTIPSCVQPGITRLRVMSAFATTISQGDACSRPDWGEVEDYDIEISGVQGVDVGVSSINSPIENDAPYDIENLNVTVSNFGDSTLFQGDTIPIHYKSSLMDQVETVQYELQSDLACDGNLTLDLDELSFACVGAHDLKVWTDKGGDVNNSNDTAASSIVNSITAVSEDFEDSESSWYSYTASVCGGCPSVTPPNSITTDATDEVYAGSESAKAEHSSSGACGVSGIAKDFDFGAPADSLSVWIRAEIENWGRASVYIHDADSAEPTKVWEQNQSGSSTTVDWFELRVDLSNFSSEFTVIIGNGDDSNNNCNNGDHGWEIWADNLNIKGAGSDDTSNQTPSNLCFDVPDSVYVNSPYEFEGGFSGFMVNDWISNGDIIESDTGNITHSFSDEGIDTFQLASAGCFGFDTCTEYVEVVEPYRAPKADFFAVKNYVDTGEVVDLRDLSEIGPTSWEWKVQPGSVDNEQAYQFVNSGSSSRNPNLEFFKPGRYKVTLIAGNSQGNDTLVRSEYIIVSEGHQMCGDVTSSDQAVGHITDPGGRDSVFLDDGDARTCHFLIQPDCSEEVTLTMETFDMVNDLCSGASSPNSIKIYDGTTVNGTPLHAEAGYPEGFTNGDVPARPFSLTAESGAMLVTYSTNGCDNGANFDARWNTQQSTDSASKSQISASVISGPDTVYAQSVASFGSSNHLQGTDYKWLLPDDEILATSDSLMEIQFGTDTGWHTIRMVSRYCGYKDTAVKEVYIKEVTQKPVADFIASRREFKAGDTIRLLDQSKNGVSQFEWTIEPSNGVAFVNGTDSSSRNPYITIESPGFYRLDLVVTNSEGQDVKAKINYLEVIAPCSPVVGDNNSDYAINEFAISRLGGSMNYSNVTSYGENGYSQFVPDPSIELQPGGEYVVELRRNSSFNDIAYGIWLDINNDGRFTANEQLLAESEFSGNTYVDTIAIPASATHVTTTNLRIASNHANEGLNGCGPHAGGEFEDYQVDLIGDQTPPVLTLKGADTISTDVCASVPADTGATAYDAVEGNLTGQIQIENVGMINANGTHELVYKVSDSRGNMATKTQTVMVSGTDTSDPEIILQGQKSMQIQVFEDFEEPGFTTSDQCGAVETMNISGNVNTDILGQYPVTYLARDYNGNRAIETRMVNVADTIAPEAELVGRDTVRINVFGDFEDEGITAHDNYYDSTSITMNGHVDENRVGTYHLNYEVSDPFGNVTTVTRVVIVEDNEAPELSESPEVVEHDVDTPFTLPFRVEDNYYDQNDINVTREGSFFRHFPDGTPDSLGFYNARITVTDGSGNRQSTSFGIQVVDRIKPEVELMGDEWVRLQRWEEYEDTLGVTYSVSDNYYDADELEVDRTGTYFREYVEAGYPDGLYEIRYKVTDPSGNESRVESRGIRIVNNNTSIQDAESPVEVEVYPNPSDGRFNLNISLQQTERLTVDVINAQGQQVETLVNDQNSKGGEFDVNLEELSAGLYQIRIHTQDEVVTKSIVISK